MDSIDRLGAALEKASIQSAGFMAGEYMLTVLERRRERERTQSMIAFTVGLVGAILFAIGASLLLN